MKPEPIVVTRKLFSELTEFEISRWNHLHESDMRGKWAFMSPKFAEAINACVVDVHVLVLSRGTRIVGYMAIQRSDGLLGFLGLFEPAGFPMCDYFGLVAEPDLQVSWEILLSGAKIPCLFFSHLDQEQLRLGLTGGQPRVGHRTRVGPDGRACWEQFKKTDKELVKDVDRRYRKLEKERGLISFEMEAASPDDALRTLLDWKSSQYLRTGQYGGVLLQKRYVDALRYFLAHKTKNAYPVLSVLRSGGKIVAAHYGLLSGGVLHRWFPSYDPEYANYSPGKILYKEMLLNAKGLGITCIDRGDGDSMAKRDFATEEHFYYKGLVHAGFRGALVALMRRIFWKLKIA